MSNRLLNQTSPYLIQHADNPVDWYPWGAEAFEKARQEDKPVFLSIGYSTCHWCHVMAHECFEDQEIADILNAFFVSVKVDKEERPDIDNIYMSFCQAYTGSGGWPMSILMTAEQKPFFAGTYLPKTNRHGAIGLKDLLLTVNKQWENDRHSLLHSADTITEMLFKKQSVQSNPDEALSDRAYKLFTRNYDEIYGGFGNAPKFPAPHNLAFLLQRFIKHGDQRALEMAEKTLLQMYKGGLFDHIGYGFCRYATDRFFLVPHFEKMLYDNALLIHAYARAFEVTKNTIYREIGEKTADYLLSEMQSEDGGFFSAQDADSDGEEGKYYVFTPDEIVNLLGEKDGLPFCEHYQITKQGNFEGKSIPNLLKSKELTNRFDTFLPKLRSYRKERTRLHTDDKILTAWNAMTIAALCALYKVSEDKVYLNAAERALKFIQSNLIIGNTLYVSWRDGKRSGKGFLDDYAWYIYALLAVYNVTFDCMRLKEAEQFTEKTINDLFDNQNGGFFLSGQEHETLIARPKESYDGAIPSGNSIMTYNLVRLHYLIQNKRTDEVLNKQLLFMAGEAKQYPAGYAMFLLALSDYLDSPTVITIVGDTDDYSDLPFIIPSDAVVKILREPTSEYRLLNGQTAFYRCENNSCKPPVDKKEFYKQFANR